jgi:hypothetical protein
MLCLTTCVGLGYGPRASSPRGFSRQHGITHFACDGSASGLGLMARGFACAPPRTLTPGQPPPGRATLLRHPSGSPTAGSARPGPRAPRKGSAAAGLASPGPAWAAARGYGNINPLSIDYACRPRLRPRLTLGGLACPRNPWSFGGRVSHPSFATHACILTRAASTAGSLRCFTRRATLPYPPARLDPPCGGPGGARAPRLRRRA